MQNRTDQWALLAGVRFFLALSVVTCHCFLVIGKVDAKHFLWTFGGFTAVIGFFMISGYSIAHSIEQKPEGYARRRFLRIYPLFFFSLFFGLLPFALFGHTLILATGEKVQTPTATLLVETLFMLNGILCSTPFFVHPCWSLSCEALYYCFAPALRKLSSQSFMIIILISACLYVLHITQGVHGYPDEVHGTTAICLLWAWLIGFVYYQFRSNYNILVMLALIGTALLSWFRADEGDFTFVTYFLVILTLLFSNRITVSSKIARLLNYLGDLSYPLYLTHFTVLIILSQLHLIVFGYAAVLICWICALIVSILFYHFIDLPFRRKLSISYLTKHAELAPAKA